jgi:hypothetical protein
MAGSLAFPRGRSQLRRPVVAGLVTVANFQTILGYAQQHHLARLTFWSVNRDRPCAGGLSDSCSGVGQAS